MCDILLYGSILASITDMRSNTQCVRTITSCAFIHSKGGSLQLALNKDLAGPVTSALPLLLSSALPSVNHAQDLA